MTSIDQVVAQHWPRGADVCDEGGVVTVALRDHPEQLRCAFASGTPASFLGDWLSRMGRNGLLADGARCEEQTQF